MAIELAAVLIGIAIGIPLGVSIEHKIWKRPKTEAEQSNECLREYCKSLRKQSCGSGLCAHHHYLYCTSLDKVMCDDPRPVPTGLPGHKPTIIKGGKS